MLQDMRKQASSWIIKVLLGIIVIVFMFFGVGSFRTKLGNYVATINGQQISKEEYNTAYKNMIQELQQRFGDNLSPEMIKMFQVEKKAMDRLIAQTLILQEAERLGIAVSKDELKAAIREMPVFQKNGGFDYKTYKTLLDRIQMNQEKFEFNQKKLMLVNRLQGLILDSIKVSDSEAKSWYNWQKEQVDINFIRFSPDKIEGITPTEEEIKTFYDKYKNKYKTDAKVKVRFLKFASDAYASKVELTPEEISAYYHDNPEMFSTPKTVEARHILIKLNPSASDEIVEEARKKAQDIHKKATKINQDFAELAKKYSEGPSKSNGGYLGAFKKDAMVKPFSDKAFSMKAGDISEPVRTDFGWHIIKVEKVNEAHTKTLEEAEPAIKKTLISEKTKSMAYDEALTVFEVSIDGDDLIKAAAEKSMKVQTTDFFTKKTGPKISIPDRSKFISMAFDLPDMEISDVLELNNAYYILQVVEKVPQQVSDLADVKDKVTQDLIKEMTDKKASENANTFLAALKNGASMKAEAEKQGLEMQTTGFFTRNEAIPIIGRENSVSNEAFMLNHENKLPEQVINARNEYYVIEFKEKKYPDAKDFEKEKTSIIETIKQQKSSNALELWIADLKAKSEINIKDEYRQYF